MTPQTNTPLPWISERYGIKRYGATTKKCDIEPVQPPGCVQAHGAMLVSRLTAHTIDGVALVEFEATGRTRASEPDYHALAKKTLTRLKTAKTLQQSCDLTAHEFRVLTGHDRVMIYKFHADAHGEVLAESKRADLDPWLGLHYPARYIPPASSRGLQTDVGPLDARRHERTHGTRSAHHDVSRLSPRVAPVHGASEEHEGGGESNLADLARRRTLGAHRLPPPLRARARAASSAGGVRVLFKSGLAAKAGFPGPGASRLQIENLRDAPPNSSIRPRRKTACRR